ncbi:hypothetical protein A2U01_0070546, partial [Trifolium medium]|nr:hypothetical protein [Trifolium medium]
MVVVVAAAVAGRVEEENGETK